MENGKNTSEHTSESKNTAKGFRNKQRKNTLLAAALMIIPFSVFMYTLFTSSSDIPEAPGSNGINLTIPEGKSQQTESSKQKAVEKIASEDFAQGRMNTLGDMHTPSGELAAVKAASSANESYMDRSQYAYQEATRQVDNFYSESANSDSTEQLQQELEELKTELAKRKADSVNKQDQTMELIEKQYALASKYFNMPKEEVATTLRSSDEKQTAIRVQRVENSVVSALPQHINDSVLAAALSSTRNYQFNTAVGINDRMPPNAVSACIAEDQTISGESRIKLRLTEALQAGENTIPANTLLYGEAKPDGQRLHITVTSIEYEGNIIPVKLTVYDMDGQTGIFNPNSAERSALKEGAANIGAGFGTSISFARSAGQQVAMDVVRGVMSGGSQYLSAKMREQRISVKTGYKVLLSNTK